MVYSQWFKSFPTVVIEECKVKNVVFGTATTKTLFLGTIMEVKGEAWEFESIHKGGPFDGLETSVISFNPNPPVITFHIVDRKLGYSGEKSLGKKLLAKWSEPHIRNDTKVAVYRLEGSPTEYSEEDVVPYHFKETLLYLDYKKKYT